MRNTSIAVLLAPALLVAWVPAPAQAQDVKYEKYRLDNGMTVILHEDHSLPVTCINLWYYVASKDEAPGRSGFAHLFEHLMFMGTHRVPEGAFDTIMEGGGGWNNASTSKDRTNYFSFGPSNLLPTLLWLDADRLEDLGNAMTQEKLDKQRAVVRNERRQTSEMQPYGKAELKVPELMYPVGHPYAHTVIGSHADLEAATVDDVKSFFANYYVPSNCSLVVAGDFDPAIIKPRVNKLFGSLPRRPDPIHRMAGPVTLPGVQRVTFTDKVQFARTSMVYHSPAHYEGGDAEMDLVAALLTSGKSSRLYKRLVYEDKLATSVRAYQASQFLGSLFHIVATARPGVSLDRVEKAIDEEIHRMVYEGVGVEELERHKAAIEVNMISSLQSLLTKADRLNGYNFFRGEPNSFSWDLDRYRFAEDQRVGFWAGKVLAPERRLIMRVLPESGELNPADRDQRPKLEVARSFTPQAPESFVLSNGIQVRHWRRSELPLVNLSMLLRGGSIRDTTPGRAYLTAAMLDEGAGDLGALAFSDALEMLGAGLTASADHESTRVGLSVLKRNADRAVALYADAIMRTRFESAEWDRVRGLHLESLRQAEDRATAVAGRVGMRSFFGDDHPYGRPVSGTVESVESLSLDDVKRFHRETFGPANATILVAGDLTTDEAKALLENAFGKWRNDATTKPPASASWKTAHRHLRVVVVDKPDSAQTVIRFYMPGPSYSTPNRTKLVLLNTILGGSFTSRLNQNLREDKGYTYGARCSFAMDPRQGYFTASSNVQSRVTGAALGEFLKEFKKIRGGDVSADEMTKARLTRRTNMIQSFQGLRGILAMAATLELNELPFSSIGDELNAIGDVTKEALNKLAGPSIPLEQAVIVLVGDKKTILAQIADLGLPTPTELTVTGEPAG
ncbi:MAG: pitrilysin family protein [Planctomycetota bacterium]|nr:pitrilysin family protein [Planctomycetota bacterium]